MVRSQFGAPTSFHDGPYEITTWGNVRRMWTTMILEREGARGASRSQHGADDGCGLSFALSALTRSHARGHHEPCASRGAEEQSSPAHSAHKPVHWATCSASSTAPFASWGPSAAPSRNFRWRHRPSRRCGRRRKVLERCGPPASFSRQMRGLHKTADCNRRQHVDKSLVSSHRLL
jgi:hypothetical protein